MAGLEIVDVVIGLTLVYLLLASICSLIRERIEAVLKTRAVNLERAIRELLQDRSGTGLTKLLYDHPLVYGLFNGDYDPSQISARTGLMPSRTTLPSYIPAANFAQALLDVVGRPAVAGSAAAPAGTSTLDALRNAAGLLDNPMVQRMVQSAIAASGDDPQLVRKNIEDWYNSAMDRLSGRYRRNSQQLILLLSLVIAVVVNANTLTIVERLSVDPSLRQALVQQAGATAAAKDSAPSWQTLGQLSLPLGWSERWPGPSGNPLATRPDTSQGYNWNSLWFYVFHPLLGLLLTAFAVSLGAPFWFDTLNRFVALRSTLKPVLGDAGAAPAAAAPAVVQVQLPAAAATSAPSASPASPPAAAPPSPSFVAHEWAQGNPQEGVL